MLLEITEIFGPSATQNSETLSVSKADLALLPRLNPAEAVMAVMLLNATEVFSGDLVDPAGTDVCDETGSSITYDQTALYPVLNVSYWQLSQLRIRNGKQYRAYTWLADFFVSPPPTSSKQFTVSLLPSS